MIEESMIEVRQALEHKPKTVMNIIEIEINSRFFVLLSPSVS